MLAHRGCHQFHQPSRAICRRISNARRSTGFTSGDASWPQVVEVMEQIKSRTRTHGRRYGSGFRQAEGLGGLEVYHQIEFRRLLDREIAGLRAFEDLIDKERQVLE